jgi:predicted AlkP superfamily phosphohydrolase/phosphomutase
MKGMVIKLFLLLILTFAIAGCSIQKEKRPEVVLIGIDGADWNNLLPFINEGILPNFKTLLRNGTFGFLKTFPPARSPVVWTSIATGKNMIKHGIIDWAYINEKGIQIPYSQNELKASRVWEILNLSGKKVGVINWFCTFPAERVNGYIVSDAFRHGVATEDFEGRITYPYRLLNKIKPMLRRGEKGYLQVIKEEDLLNVKKTNLSEEHQEELKIWILQDKVIEDVSLHLLSTVKVDFFATYFRMIDVIGHYSARMVSEDLGKEWWEECRYKGGVSKKTQKRFEKEIREIFKPYYIYIDRVVGKFLKRAPRGSKIIIVSDHGFSLSCECFGHYCPEPPDGILIMKGDGIKKGFEIKNATIYDITPTILYIFGMPIAKDMDGKVILDAFQPDFKKQREITFIESYEKVIKSEKEERYRNRKLDEETLEQLRSLGYIK